MQKYEKNNIYKYEIISYTSDIMLKIIDNQKK